MNNKELLVKTALKRKGLFPWNSDEQRGRRSGTEESEQAANEDGGSGTGNSENSDEEDGEDSEESSVCSSTRVANCPILPFSRVDSLSLKSLLNRHVLTRWDVPN